MAEAKKTAAKPAAETTRELASAAGSSDPAVHQLIAERQSAVLNGDDGLIAECDKRLADLGYSA